MLIRRRLPILFIFAAMAFLASRARGSSSQDTRQDVTVTAVEIPVRVLLDGHPVRDLSREDFEVLENGLRQGLTHFEIISRRIAAGGDLGAPAGSAGPPGRTFLLIINVFDYTDSVGEALDYLFREVFRRGDRVVLVTEAQSVLAESWTNADQAASGLKESLRTYKTLSTARIGRTFLDLRHEADRLIGALEGHESSPEAIESTMLRFFRKYTEAWNAFRIQFLVLDLGFYENLILRMQATGGEKWAICFQQREMFPQVKNLSRLERDINDWVGRQIDPENQVKARQVQAAWEELKRQFDLSRLVSSEALNEMFLRAGIPFHLVLMKSLRRLGDEDLEFREVGQDYEDALTRISRATGGYRGFTNRPLDALKEAVQLEDYHYLLVYMSKNPDPQGKRKIEVRVPGRKVEVLSLKDYVAPARAMLTITDFKSGGRAIGFALSRYQMTGPAGRQSGQAEVRVTLYDSESKAVFDEAKVLQLLKKEIRINLNFPELEPGRYYIMIRAIDKIAGHSDVFSGMIELRDREVPGPAARVEGRR